MTAQSARLLRRYIGVECRVSRCLRCGAILAAALAVPLIICVIAPLPRAASLITAVLVADVAAIFVALGVGRLCWAVVICQTRDRRPGRSRSSEQVWRP